MDSTSVDRACKQAGRLLLNQGLHDVPWGMQCSRGKRPGEPFTSCTRRGDIALKRYQSISLNNGFRVRVLVLDMDQRPDARVLAPDPNIRVRRLANGHEHWIYFLIEPVHHPQAGGRLKPYAYFKDIREALTELTGADPGYINRLFHNPVYLDERPGWNVSWLRREAYSLKELAEYRPVEQTVQVLENPIIATGAGSAELVRINSESRHVDLYKGAMVFLGRWENRDLPALPELRRMNAQLARSRQVKPVSDGYCITVATWLDTKIRPRWKYHNGQRMTDAEFSSKQSYLGAIGGKVSRRPPMPTSERTLKPWENLGISRKTYYKRKARGGVTG